MKPLFVRRGEKCDKKLYSYFFPPVAVKNSERTHLHCLLVLTCPASATADERTRRIAAAEAAEAVSAFISATAQHNLGRVRWFLGCRLLLLLVDDGGDAAGCGRRPLF